MAMTTATVDKLIWVLVYAGLLSVCLGLFVMRNDLGLGWGFVVVGVVLTVVGATLVWVRSRMSGPGA